MELLLRHTHSRHYSPQVPQLLLIQPHPQYPPRPFLDLKYSCLLQTSARADDWLIHETNLKCEWYSWRSNSKDACRCGSINIKWISAVVSLLQYWLLIVAILSNSPTCKILCHTFHSLWALLNSVNSVEGILMWVWVWDWNYEMYLTGKLCEVTVNINKGEKWHQKTTEV